MYYCQVREGRGTGAYVWHTVDIQWMLKEFGVNDIVPHFCFSNRTKQGSEGISLGGYKEGLILGSRLLGKIPLIGCGQGIHFCRGHCKTHLPAPLSPGSGGAARSRRRNRAARRAAGAGHSCTASPGSRERLPGPSGRSYGTTPFRIGRALNPGAGIRSRTLLGTGHSGERTCGGATYSPAAPARRRLGPSPRVCRPSLAPCGFLGDVAPPLAQASFRLGERPRGSALDRAERCRGSLRAARPVSASGGGPRGWQRRGGWGGGVGTAASPPGKRRCLENARLRGSRLSVSWAPGKKAEAYGVGGRLGLPSEV